MVFLSAPTDSKQVREANLADDIDFEQETMGHSHLNKRKCFDSSSDIILTEQSQLHMADENGAGSHEA